jgi:hypothetical protein
VKKQANRWIGLGVLGVMVATSFGGFGTSLANASTKGRRNTALALGAVTAYGLIKKKKTVAIAGAVGTAVAYRQYRISKKRDNRRDARRRAWYQRRYGRNWYRYYRAGV